MRLTRGGRAAPAFLLGILLFVSAFTCQVIPTHADQSQTFVWVADTRGDANNDLISTNILTPIVNSILAMSPAPTMVIFGGDAAYRGGYEGGPSNLPEFRTVFTDRLLAKGIPSVFAVGNHELYTMNHAPNLGDRALSRQQEFQTYFNSADMLTVQKQVGPAGLTNLAFSFHIGNSLFIVADSFLATANGVEPSYGINAAQQAWMKGLLETTTASHNFVLTHVPAWSPGNTSPNGHMANTWTTITTSGNATNTNASILFAGHEHLYFRTLHDGTYEVLAGTGGAPSGCEVGETCNLTLMYPGDVLALRYNYAVTSINGRYITVSVFDQFNSSIDRFYFFDNSGVNNAVINNAIAIAPDPLEQRPTGILAGSYNTITNSASISNVATGIDAVNNNTISNSGNITPGAGGNGIHVYDNNTITNTVTGSITGNSTGLWGIRVNTGNTVVNQGTVAVTGTNSNAFLAAGDNNTLTNTGALSASGTGSYAVRFLGAGNALLNSGTISGNIWFGGGNSTLTNNGTINGSGGLYKAGTGTLTILGATSYTGGTYLKGGTLSVSSDASLGAASGKLTFDGGTLQPGLPFNTSRHIIVNSGGGSFNNNGQASSLGGSFSGSGPFTFVGSAALTLSGNGTAYTGQATVSEGSLLLTPGASLGGTLTVNPGATVGGYGTLGYVINNGTVSPGGSIGTLSIVGDYTQGPQAKLLIEVASPTSNDILAVTGSAYLNGTLQTSWLGGATPAIGTVFGAFLTATAGVGGRFSSLLNNITPTVVFTPKYNIPDRVYLVVERDYMNPALLPYLNTNQRAVGGMLNSVGNTATGDLNTVLTAIDALPRYNQIPGVYDQIAPRGTEAIFRMGLSSTVFQAGNISDRLFDIRRGVKGASLDGTFIRNSDFIREGRDKPVLIASAGPNLAGMLPPGADDKWGIFVKGNAVSGDQRDTPDQMGYRFTSAGVTFGMDYRFTSNLAAGLLLGYTGSRATVDDYDSKVKMDGYTAGVYGTWYSKGFFIDGQASYGWADYRNTRRIVFAGIDRTATSKPSGRQLTLYGGTGYELNVSKWTLVPTASLQYIKLNLDSFTESGAGALNLSVNSQDTQSLMGNIGGRIYYTFDTGRALIMPFIHASYGYEFLGGAQTVTSRLAQGSSPFTIETPSPDRNFVLCGAGVSMFLHSGASLNIGYTAQIGMDKYIAHSINGGLKMTF